MTRPDLIKATSLAAAAVPIAEVMGTALPADTMGGLFWHRVRTAPDAIGFRFENECFTNAELAALVDRIRASLRRDGAERGARVAAFMHNSPFILALFMACASDGFVFCPMNVALRRSDLAYTLGDLAPFACFFDAELAEIYLPAAADAGVADAVAVGQPSQDMPPGIRRFEDWLTTADRTGADPNISASDPLCIIYSGGNAMANAVVTLTATGVNKTAKTDGSGAYKFSSLNASLTYTVTVSGRSSSVAPPVGQVVLVVFNL